jgi:adenosylcobinamide-phosphate synthase
MSTFAATFADALHASIGFLEPRFFLWAALGLGLDALIGDPIFAAHPIRLLGRLLAFYERVLFRLGANGYAGGIAMLFLLTSTVLPLVVAFLSAAHALHPYVFDAAAGLVCWACLALRDLIAHGERIARAVARGDLAAARHHVSMLVGRDTDKMDLAACGRGAVESMAENLVDGVLSPLVFLLLFGPLAAVLFKIVSTMDSMVGYKSDRYLRFGWCGARTDDLANFLPARWSWLLLSGLAALLPGYSGRKAWRCGRAQHALVPGPNSGWPECTIAGALRRRLIGPLFKNGVQVCNLWLGEPTDPAGADPRDIRRTYVLLIFSTLVTYAALASAALLISP